MDDRRFDALTRVLAGVPSRRAVLSSLAGLLGGALTTGEAGAAPVRTQLCIRLGKRCKGRKHHCCGKAKCRNGRCRCKAKQKACGQSCIAKSACCRDRDCKGGRICRNGSCVCPPGMKGCQGSCIPTENCCTNANCGSCESCVSGRCQTGCQPGQECRDGTCACTTTSCPGCCATNDTCRSGESNGACGSGGETCVECEGGTTCQDGQCRCPAGEKVCNDRCIPENDCCTNGDCAACESCQRGACVSGCREGQECLDGRCACTPESCTGCCDGDDCRPGNRLGACGSGGGPCAECTGGTTCQDGQCRCPEGEKDCSGRCIPAGDCCTSDDCGPCESCQRGACVSGCEPGQECVNDRCACTDQSCAGCCAGDICRAGDSDRACGADGAQCVDCGANADCVDGSCRCDPGFSPCGDPQVCVNMQADPQHCGDCATACPPGVACRDGVCGCTIDNCDGCCDEAGTCRPGGTTNECGMNGDQCIVCQEHSLCLNGKCICEERYKRCEGECIPRDQCCGGCDECDVCRDGTCVNEGLKPCDGTCIPTNECCGGCPTCHTCQNGTCVPIADLPPTCCTNSAGASGVCRGGQCGFEASPAQCGGACNVTLCGNWICPACSGCDQVGCARSTHVGQGCGDEPRYCITETVVPGGCFGGPCYCPAGSACDGVTCYEICTAS